MTARLVTTRCTAIFLLLAMAGGGWCQTQLLDPEPRTCRTQDNADDRSVLSQGRRNEYPAGGVLMVLAKVPAGLFGCLEIYLCPDGNAEDECLDRVPLQLADGSGTSYSLQKVPRTDRYEIPVILPDDITCPTCTLQLSVLTGDCDDEEDCPQTEDTFCSDITVRQVTNENENAGLETSEDIDDGVGEGDGNEVTPKDTAISKKDKIKKKIREMKEKMKKFKEKTKAKTKVLAKKIGNKGKKYGKKLKMKMKKVTKKANSKTKTMKSKLKNMRKKMKKDDDRIDSLN